MLVYQRAALDTYPRIARRSPITQSKRDQSIFCLPNRERIAGAGKDGGGTLAYMPGEKEEMPVPHVFEGRRRLHRAWPAHDPRICQHTLFIRYWVDPSQPIDRADSTKETLRFLTHGQFGLGGATGERLANIAAFSVALNRSSR